MATKAEIVSKDTIKPFSPTPNHLRDFKISLLDQLAPSSNYVPVVLFYTASDVSVLGNDIKMISDKLKSSLSNVLTLYYPFCGILKDNSTVECNDEGVLYIESKVPKELSNILKNPLAHEINELFPFDLYNPEVDHKKKPIRNMAVQLNEFSCGGIGLGVCFSHKIADASTVSSFLNAWSAKARGDSNIVAPQMEAALHFPPMNIEIDITRGMAGHKNIVTKRFIFNGKNISKLRDKLGCFKPTRVEAVTALIWKSAMEAAKASSGEQTRHASMVSHAVNICSRMDSPLLRQMLGNLWVLAVSPLVEVEEVVGLDDLAEIVRKTVKKVDADYVKMLQGDELPMVLEAFEEARKMVTEKGIPCYSFSSWTRFDLYNVDFGWGKPTWVCTIGLPIQNVVIFLATKNGDGIEAWITLTEHDMVEFERNPQLLEFASFDF